MVTVSLDGSIKVWSRPALVGEGDAVKSESTFYVGQIEQQSRFCFICIVKYYLETKLKTGAWMNKGQYFTVGDINGEVNIMDLSAPKEKKVVSKVSFIFYFL